MDITLSTIEQCGVRAYLSNPTFPCFIAPMKRPHTDLCGSNLVCAACEHQAPLEPTFLYFIAPLKLTMSLGSCCGHRLLPTSSRVAYVPTTRTDLPLLHRPGEVDDRARLPPCGHLPLRFNYRVYVLRHSNAPLSTSSPR